MKDVSALMDGELEAKKVRSTIVRLEDQDELWDAWSTFHVIRDTLQGNAIGPSTRFSERFHERLEREPLPVLPWWQAWLPGTRTLLWAGGAALLAVIALAIALRGGLPQPGSDTGAVPAGPAGVIGSRFDDQVAVEYAMAHRQLVPAFVAASRQGQ